MAIFLWVSRIYKGQSEFYYDKQCLYVVNTKNQVAKHVYVIEVSKTSMI
jgi:hypothetical protein